MRQAEVPEAYTWDRGNMLISIRCVRGFAQLIPSVVSRRQRPLSLALALSSEGLNRKLRHLRHLVQYACAPNVLTGVVLPLR